MLHGLGSRGRDLAAVAEALAPIDCRTPDLLGHGGDAAPVPSSFADFALALERSDELPERFVVVGLSFGASVAMELWSRLPGRVLGVALVDPALDLSELRRWAREGKRGPREKLTDLYRWARAGGRGPRGKVTELYWCEDRSKAVDLMRVHPLLAGLSEQQLDLNARSLVAADRKVLLGSLELDSGWKRVQRPANSHAPVTVGFGVRSSVCTEEAASTLAARLDGETWALEGGHCSHLEDPQGLARLIASLVDRSEA